jgi:membrane-associated phospholipid phosphatase
LKAFPNILFDGTFVVAAIGFSRLCLGVHFLSDVLGGYLPGLLWLIIGISTSELETRKERTQASLVPSARRCSRGKVPRGWHSVSTATYPNP